MTVHFTLLNLKRQRWRTVLAGLGVAFANLLVFVQLGFLGTIESAAVVLLSKLDCDLVLLSPEYLDLNRPGRFPSTHLYQLRADPDVQGITPLYLASNYWRIVQPRDSTREGHRRAMLMVAFPVEDQPLLLPGLSAKTEVLKETGTVLIDSRSREYFGDLSPGVETELGASRVRIVGQFALGTGFSADGMVLLSDRTFAQVNGLPLDWINLGLVKLRSGADPDQVAARLRQYLSSGGSEPVRIYTRRAIENKEVNFWQWKTSLGRIFVLGVVVALLVGGVFVYQVISSDLKNRLREFATLKAIGYHNRYLNRTILAQALAYGMLGFPLALSAALLLYGLIGYLARLPIGMPLGRVLFVLFLNVCTCAVSGLLALRRVKTLDPAELF